MISVNTLTHTSAIDEGMFSSTHFRSSSWKSNKVFVLSMRQLGTAWKMRMRSTVITHHFVGLRRTVGLIFRAPHFHPLWRKNRHGGEDAMNSHL